MTDKEQIMCKYKFQDKEKFDGKPYCICFNELCEDLFFVCDHNCQIYEDDKQLARKTQECEELKKLVVRCSEGWGKEACMKNWYQQSEQAKQEENHDLTMKLYGYRKALEEIEKICKFNLYQYIVRQSVDSSMSCLNKIRDIISKAKGEGE